MVPHLLLFPLPFTATYIITDVERSLAVLSNPYWAPLRHVRYAVDVDDAFTVINVDGV